MERGLIWLIYGQAKGVGRQRLAALMTAFPDPATAWAVGPAELAGLPGFGQGVASALLAARRDGDLRREAERELDRAQRAGLRLLLMTDPEYPARLRQIPDPPPILYQAGPWVADERPAIAIVGTRNPTGYGLAVAEELGRELTRLGAVVVSGMARGIDSVAHRGALAHGTSVAVLGGGADVCYPREAASIYRAMKERGAILSEQPAGTQPRREHFPERNRIISGLCDGVIVVEAGEQSGTLITVTQALQQGREVFAVPGPITSPMSVGPHRLIREGACLITSGRQVLEELGYLAPAEGPIDRSGPQGLTAEEQRLLGWMGSEPRWPDQLAEACGMSAAEVQATLTMLAIRGAVRRLPGGEYLRIG